MKFPWKCFQYFWKMTMRKYVIDPFLYPVECFENDLYVCNSFRLMHLLVSTAGHNRLVS